MVTSPKARKSAQKRPKGQFTKHLYLKEWMIAKRLNDESLAESLDVDRVTVTRWRNQRRRPDQDMIAKIAKVMDIEPGELWSPPPTASRPSIDAMLRGTEDDFVRRIAEVTAVLLKPDAP